MKKVLLVFLCFMIAMTLQLPVMAATDSSEDANTILTQSKGKTDENRQLDYEKLQFDIKDWFTGKVIAKDPFAVVADMPLSGAEYAAKLRVWTGVLARAGQDLIAVWDEIWLDRDGKFMLAMLDVSHGMPGYFSADHQRVYRTEAYIGIFPWAWIPTDKEAAKLGLSPVSGKGNIDLYNNDFGDDLVDLIDKGAIEHFTAIPSRIVNRTPFTEQRPSFSPLDIDGHWGRAYMLDLIGKGVLHGYEDQAVRPDKTLSRAEFVSLLLQAVHLEPAGKSAYKDLAGHWSSGWVAAAEDNGIVAKGSKDKAFKPNEPLTRMEMALMLEQALSLLYLTDADKTKSFSDTKGLDGEQQIALQVAAGYGILTGFEDGTFRPERKLKRAEAFVVISKLIELQ